MAEPGTAVIVRRARPEDAPELAALMIAELHTRLADLGGGVVEQLTRHMTASAYCVCMVAERQGAVAGYMAVLTPARRFYLEFLLRRGMACALIALPRLLTSAVWRTMFTGLAYVPRTPSTDPDADCVVLAVRRADQRTGIGEALFRRTADELRVQGITALKICTDTDNVPANAMYRRRCRLIRCEPLYHDTRLNVYVCDL